MESLRDKINMVKIEYTQTPTKFDLFYKDDVSTKEIMKSLERIEKHIRKRDNREKKEHIRYKNIMKILDEIKDKINIRELNL